MESPQIETGVDDARCPSGHQQQQQEQAHHSATPTATPREASSPRRSSNPEPIPNVNPNPQVGLEPYFLTSEVTERLMAESRARSALAAEVLGSRMAQEELAANQQNANNGQGRFDKLHICLSVALAITLFVLLVVVVALVFSAVAYYRTYHNLSSGSDSDGSDNKNTIVDDDGLDSLGGKNVEDMEDVTSAGLEPAGGNVTMTSRLMNALASPSF